MTEEEYEHMCSEEEMERETWSNYTPYEQYIASRWNTLEHDIPYAMYTSLKEFEENNDLTIIYHGLVSPDQVTGIKQDSDFEWCEHEYVDKEVEEGKVTYSYEHLYLPFNNHYIKLSYGY